MFVGALDVVNPDALIVSTNAHYQHLEVDGHFDERPFSSFSSDATPEIVAALPTLSPETRQRVEARLRKTQRWLSESQTNDWRAFNLSRAQATQALASLR